MKVLLELTGLKKKFGERELFHIDSLLIGKGQAYLLSGPNGAGKSTLLRILAGLEPATVQAASYQGRPVSLHPYSPHLRRAIVYVHQHPVMFDRTLAANVGYGLQGSGLSRREINERVDEAIAWANIAHLHKLPTASLSGGEKQRVALARARAVRPELLLLDEPTASLDGAARDHVMELIPQLLNEGVSLIITSHERDLMNLPGATSIVLALQRLILQCEQERQTVCCS